VVGAPAAVARPRGGDAPLRVGPARGRGGGTGAQLPDLRHAGRHADGAARLARFSRDPWPTWTYALPNGLRVVLHPNKKLPVVHVNLWYHVGSADERLGRSGFAHLYEHLMFQGSVNATADYLKYMERAGANLFEGGVNGTTDFDRTNYFETVPSGNLETVLWAESDRLATLATAITPAKLDNQRDVVKNERRQGLENVPYGRAFKLMFETMFPINHPYGHDVIGTQEDLTAASLEDVRAFFRTYYTPNNLSLAITGDFDPAEAKRLIEKYFSGIPPGPALDRTKRHPVTLTGERLVVVNDRVPLARSYVAWPTPAAGSRSRTCRAFLIASIAATRAAPRAASDWD